MWDDDWPACLLRASYAQALSFLPEPMAVLLAKDLAWILDKTALGLWRFP